ncbi:MAG: helix-turn-helix domain-containing protein [Mycolicibacterium rufum]|nr:helix-turn-helix domain-containing protein [Mycolicibacterium rufum]
MAKSNPRVVAPVRLGIAEAATYLSVDECTIRRWIRAGTLKANRVGPKIIRIDKAELDRLVEAIGGNATRR